MASGTKNLIIYFDINCYLNCMKTRLPTLKDIGNQLKISTATVSRALHNHPRIGVLTKTRVQQLAKKLNYVPN